MVSNMDKDEYYRDILEGLSVYFASPFIGDILNTLSEFDAPDLGAALNKNQITAKKWLAEQLHAVVGGDLGIVYVMGGWHGVLGAILLHDNRLNIEAVVSIDKDPRCRPIAESLNRTHVENDRFRTITADISTLSYEELFGRQPPNHPPDVLINTSCEHIRDFTQWYERIPAQTLQVLQSNNYYACEEHINCVSDLESFRRQAPMHKVLFDGSLRLKKYTRFMLIGHH